MTTTKNTTEQVEQERQELDAVVKIPIAQFQPRAKGESGRCGWCGQFAEDLVEAERNSQTGEIRYKGVKCCGCRHL